MSERARCRVGYAGNIACWCCGVAAGEPCADTEQRRAQLVPLGRPARTARELIHKALAETAGGAAWKCVPGGWKGDEHEFSCDRMTEVVEAFLVAAPASQPVREVRTAREVAMEFVGRAAKCNLQPKEDCPMCMRWVVAVTELLEADRKQQ